MKIVLLLVLLTVSECSSLSVVGQTGQNVTLSCKYNYKYYKALPVCWGRGYIPNVGCNNQLIATDGHRVLEETRASSRYQLLGRLDEGDVSLTILKVTASDAGRYECRVNIYGWFNDDKHHFDLTVEEAARTTAVIRETTTETTTESTTESTTSGYTTETILTSSSRSIEAEQQQRSIVLVALMCFLFNLAALILSGGLIIVARRWSRLDKISQQQVYSRVQFSLTSPTRLLFNRGLAAELVHQIDRGAEYSCCEYKLCPESTDLLRLETGR